MNNAVEESGKIDKKKEGYGKVKEDELAIGDMVVHEAGLDSDLWIETRLAGRGRLEWKCDSNWLMIAPACNMRVVSEKRIGTPQPTAEKTKNLEPMSSTALIALNVQTMLRHMMVIQENMDKFEKRPK